MAFGLEAITAAPQAILGGIEAIQGLNGLRNLQGQPMPQYSMSPEFQDYFNTTKQRSGFGFDANEKAAFGQSVAQQQNTGFRQAVDQAGGGLSQAIAAGLGQQKLGAFNQFAGQDAQLHRQNLQDYGQAAGQIQGQQNLINQNKIAQRNMLEQQYGGALRAGLGNITSGLTSGLGLGFMSGKTPNTLGGTDSSNTSNGFGSPVNVPNAGSNFGSSPYSSNFGQQQYNLSGTGYPVTTPSIF